MKCPICQNEAVKALYYGLPHWLCWNGQCNCLFGFWENFTRFLPFNGHFMTYDGAYLGALCSWIRGDYAD